MENGVRKEDEELYNGRDPVKDKHLCSRSPEGKVSAWLLQQVTEQKVVGARRRRTVVLQHFPSLLQTTLAPSIACPCPFVFPSFLSSFATLRDSTDLVFFNDFVQ